MVIHKTFERGNKMKKMHVPLFLSLGLISFNAFAIGTYTTIESGITIYSEYYPNNKTSFKGTVVFENGSGMALDQWTSSKNFLSCIKKHSSLFFYDRNGLGNSSVDFKTSVSNPITAELVTTKLIKLLVQLHIPGPYILVGHSYGGVYADYFARRYPNLVSGLVLVDPTPPHLEFSNAFKKQQAYLESWAAQPNTVVYKEHTYADEKKSNFMIPSAEVFYQIKGVAKTRQELNALSPLPNKIPIIVISSTQMESLNPMVGKWFAQQKQYLNTNSKSKAFQVQAHHTIWNDCPELVCSQINKLEQ